MNYIELENLRIEAIIKRARLFETMKVIPKDNHIPSVNIFKGFMEIYLENLKRDLAGRACRFVFYKLRNMK